MAVSKDSPELVAALNFIIKDIIDQGLYLEWMEEAIKLSKIMIQ